MQSTYRSTVVLLRRGIYVLLAIAVFVFVSQGRLAQYRPCPPSLSASKVASERKVTALPVVNASEDDPLPPAAFLLACFSYCFDRAVHEAPALSSVRAAEIALRNPVRFDLNGAYFLHRPPPVTA